MKKFGVSIYGYKKKDVNEFVVDVTDKYESMLNNLKARDRQIQDLSEKLQHYQNMEKTFNNAIMMAEDTAHQIKRLARNESNNIINEAKANASRIINQALLKSEKIEQQSQTLKHHITSMKRKLKQTLEEELAVIDDIDDIDY